MAVINNYTWYSFFPSRSPVTEHTSIVGTLVQDKCAGKNYYKKIIINTCEDTIIIILFIMVQGNDDAVAKEICKVLLQQKGGRST